MVLELSQQQFHLLHACLAESIDSLHDEVLHTDHRDLRGELRERLDRLQTLQRQVEAQMPREQPAL
ncbi:hypothetical protein D7Y13_19615 [Corallococcus praedator]|uniref:DUF2383 domain-containing protein n=1 Tax=Corallococcus praedator TaxID=2316724 RepID=A0ABX9QIG8_9BACT|nr:MULTISPECIES: hypothetical protein [Corallococcus]RKH31331.1 hypothetical protein D7X75_19590 [Corallococcus sp. CA031C]RKI06695.1 hypothetical protein D7Y13_19615 [Corallococcus praedator]